MRTVKNQDQLRNTNDALTQRQTPYTEIKDYNLTHTVRMEWDLNRDAQQERMFKLSIGDNEVILDWEEVLKAGRFI
jgi:hypothetical protein